jgi:hypothetical protein
MESLIISASPSSFVNVWHSSMKVHEIMAENRIRFSQRLNEMSDELGTLAKEVDKNRKQVCMNSRSRNSVFLVIILTIV